ncbi:methyl-accepting chemotaxis protein [Chthonobacter rhizosphaerae]|uniref:methyl-accepting chemotaxis protein n=1 Tax=Chthonobacter rhizosphaerae TaxID=2735553 RepID=UPI0015EE9203|nr:methyl-accepting chemotaxis protein [Chthonobacter rhizosphaerae]
MRWITGWIADRRTTTKIVSSFVPILALGAAVGMTGLHFVDGLQTRMERTARTTDSVSGLQKLATDVNRFAMAPDAALARGIDLAIREQAVRLDQLRALMPNAEEMRMLDLAASSVSALKARTEEAGTARADLIRATNAMEDAAAAAQRASVALSDAATRFDRDGSRKDQVARDAVKSAARLVAAATEIETASRSLAVRLVGPEDPADAAALEGYGPAAGKAVRKARAVAGSAADDLKETEALIASAKDALGRAGSGDVLARLAAAGTLARVETAAAGLRITATAALVGALDGAATADGLAVARKGIVDGASKYAAASQKLVLDALLHATTRTAETRASLGAQVDQVRQIADVVSTDAAAVPEIAGLSTMVRPHLDAVIADADALLVADKAAEASLQAVNSDLARASAVLTQLAALEKAAAAADRTAAVTGIGAALGAAVVLSLLIGTALVLMIPRPLRTLTGAMERLAAGDTDIALAGERRRDEIGDMSRAVAVFRDNALERQRLEADAARDREAREARQQTVEALVRRFEEQAEDLLGSVGASGAALQATADRLGGIASATAARAVSARNASEEASVNVQTVASASEELSASIEAISSDVQRTMSIVEAARSRAARTNEQVEALSNAATRIGDVVKLISSIAEQTNLLALNATIEAARAGEAGRGFSVVAGEVKSLAGQTAKATEEIATQVAAIQTSTADAVGAIEAIVETMQEIDRRTAEISAAVAQQGSATVEISSNVHHAAAGTSRVVADMDDLNTAVEETSESAEAVQKASAGMRATADELKAAIGGFLRGVAAA